MRILRIITLMCCTLIVSAFTAQAREWRGIIPMKSTCDDVKRILNVTTCDPPEETYDLGNEKVRISFSKSRCFKAYQKLWDVPVGTVIIIERHLKKPIAMSELGIDSTKYKITTTDVVNLNIYSSEDDGLWFYAFNDRVQDIYYRPTKEDQLLQCPSRGKSPGTRRAPNKSLDASGEGCFDSRRRVNSNVLLHRHRLREVPRLVYVATSSHGDVIGQELQRNDGQDRREQVARFWN